MPTTSTGTVRRADQPADYSHFQVRPGAVEAWEDAVRQSHASGSFEWWYFDFHLDDGAWIVVPVDMPLLSVDLLQALLATDAACACVAGHPLPMALRLDAGLRTVIKAIGARSGGERSLRALQCEVDTRLLQATRWQYALRNCNTPGEWRALQAEFC